MEPQADSECQLASCPVGAGPCAHPKAHWQREPTNGGLGLIHSPQHNRPGPGQQWYSTGNSTGFWNENGGRARRWDRQVARRVRERRSGKLIHPCEPCGLGRQPTIARYRLLRLLRRKMRWPSSRPPHRCRPETQSLVMILVCEIGDRTFFIAAIMAMHRRRITVWQVNKAVKPGSYTHPRVCAHTHAHSRAQTRLHTRLHTFAQSTLSRFSGPVAVGIARRVVRNDDPVRGDRRVVPKVVISPPPLTPIAPTTRYPTRHGIPRRLICATAGTREATATAYSRACQPLQCRCSRCGRSACTAQCGCPGPHRIAA